MTRRPLTIALGLMVVLPSFRSGAATAAEPAPLRLAQTIPLPDVKGGFDLMAADVAGKRLFVAAQDNSSVEVLDLAAGKPVRSIGGFSEPKWIVYRPETRRLFVSNGGDGTVRILNSETFKPVKSLDFKEKANNLRFDPTTKRLYVGYGVNFGAIGVIDTASNAVVGKIDLAAFPKQFELEKNGNRIFVNVPTANHVAVIDRKTQKVANTWPVEDAKENVPMGFDEASHRLFIGCAPGRFVVLDTESGKAVASLAIAADADGVYYDAARRRIYVSCGEGSVDVISQSSDADHYTLLERVLTAPGAGTSLWVPELDRLYVAVPQRENEKAEIRAYSVP